MRESTPPPVNDSPPPSPHPSQHPQPPHNATLSCSFQYFKYAPPSSPPPPPPSPYLPPHNTTLVRSFQSFKNAAATRQSAPPSSLSSRSSSSSKRFRHPPSLLVGVETVLSEGAVWPESSLLLGNVEESHAVQGVRREDGGRGLAVVLSDVTLLVARDKGRGPAVGVERVDAVLATPARAEAVVARDAVGRPALEGLVLAWREAEKQNSRCDNCADSNNYWFGF